MTSQGSTLRCLCPSSPSGAVSLHPAVHLHSHSPTGIPMSSPPHPCVGHNTTNRVRSAPCEALHTTTLTTWWPLKPPSYLVSPRMSRYCQSRPLSGRHRPRFLGQTVSVRRHDPRRSILYPKVSPTRAGHTGTFKSTLALVASSLGSVHRAWVLPTRAWQTGTVKFTLALAANRGTLCKRPFLLALPILVCSRCTPRESKLDAPRQLWEGPSIRSRSSQDLFPSAPPPPPPAPRPTAAPTPAPACWKAVANMAAVA